MSADQQPEQQQPEQQQAKQQKGKAQAKQQKQQHVQQQAPKMVPLPTSDESEELLRIRHSVSDTGLVGCGGGGMVLRGARGVGNIVGAG